MSSNVHCSSRGDLHYLAGYCSCLRRILGYPQLYGEVAALKDDPSFYCFDGEHWNSWFGSHVAVPHCTDCTHPLGSTFFVPQLGGRLGDMLSCIAAGKGLQPGYLEIRHSIPKVDWTSPLLMVREFLLLFEFVGLQFLIQNRLQSLWPALNRPGCKVWLARCLRMEVASRFPWRTERLSGHAFSLTMSSGSIIRLSVFTFTCHFVRVWRSNLLLHLERAGDSDTVSCRLDFPESPRARQRTRLGCSCHVPSMPRQKH